MHVISAHSRGQGLSARSGEDSCWTNIKESGGVVRSMGRVNVGYEVPGGPDWSPAPWPACCCWAIAWYQRATYASYPPSEEGLAVFFFGGFEKGNYLTSCIRVFLSSCRCGLRLCLSLLGVGGLGIRSISIVGLRCAATACVVTFLLLQEIS